MIILILHERIPRHDLNNLPAGWLQGCYLKQAACPQSLTLPPVPPCHSSSLSSEDLNTKQGEVEDLCSNSLTSDL